MILVGELVLLWLVQLGWCIYYVIYYPWNSTKLGPVWLGKGMMLALLWPLLTVNQHWHIPYWVWTAIVAPGMLVATTSWLVVTIYIHRTGNYLREKKNGTVQD